MVTLSVPTVPEALEPSPYEICHLSLGWLTKVLELAGLKMLWLEPDDCVEDGSSVDQTCRVSVMFSKPVNDWALTQRSAEPVSKSSMKF